MLRTAQPVAWKDERWVRKKTKESNTDDEASGRRDVMGEFQRKVLSNN